MMESLIRTRRVVPKFVGGIAAISLGLAPFALAQETGPVIRANSQEVLLDVVVRDKKDNFVRNLRADDFTVIDGGVKQMILNFRLRGSSIEGPHAQARTALDSQRPYRLVSMVFERLGPDGRRLSRQAAMDLLAAEKQLDTYFAVFAVDQRVRLLQGFTTDREQLKKAVEQATSGTPSQFAAQSENIQRALQTASDSGAGADDLAAAAGRGGASSNIGAASANAAMAKMLLGMLNFSERAGRTQQGRSSIFSLLAILHQQQLLPGRKTLLYFSEGIQVPDNLSEQFQSAISAANRANVSIYSVDARGLVIAGQNRANAEMISGVASRRYGGVQKGTGDQASAVSPDEAKLFDQSQDSLRAGTQNTLAELAEATGGFLIANSNDFRGPLRRIVEEIDLHYELSYAPRIEAYNGEFRPISVQLSRPELTVHTRSGYFALPPMVNGVLFPFEAALLTALSSTPPPRAFEYRAAGFRFPVIQGPSELTVAFQIPAASLTTTEDSAAGAYRARVSLMALIKDASGNIVDKISRELSFTGPLAEAGTFRQRTLLYNEHRPVAPGRYALETVVKDREGNRLSGRRSALVVPSVRKGPALSNIVLVRRLERDGEDMDAADQLRFPGGRITPELSGTARAAAPVGIYFVIRPDPAASEPARLVIEFWREGALAARVSPELGTADAEGKIPYVAEFPAAKLTAGDYTLRVLLTQGVAAVQEETAFAIVP